MCCLPGSIFQLHIGICEHWLLFHMGAVGPHLGAIPLCLLSRWDLGAGGDDNFLWHFPFLLKSMLSEWQKSYLYTGFASCEIHMQNLSECRRAWTMAVAGVHSGVKKRFRLTGKGKIKYSKCVRLLWGTSVQHWNRSFLPICLTLLLLRSVTFIVMLPNKHSYYPDRRGRRHNAQSMSRKRLRRVGQTGYLESKGMRKQVLQLLQLK